MKLFNQLEKHIKNDKEYLNLKVSLILDKILDKPDLSDGFFKLTGALEDLIPKLESGAGQQLDSEMIEPNNPENEEQQQEHKPVINKSLWDLINELPDSKQLIEILEEVQKVTNFIDDEEQLLQQQHLLFQFDQNDMALYEAEEIKDNSMSINDVNISPSSGKENQELIKIYGLSVRTVSWYFENDTEAKFFNTYNDQQQNLPQNIPNRGAFGGQYQPNNFQPLRQRGRGARPYNANYNQRFPMNRPPFAPEEDDDDDELLGIMNQSLAGQEKRNFEFFDGKGFEKISPDYAKGIEDLYQVYVKTSLPQESYMEIQNDLYVVRFERRSDGKFFILNTTTQKKQELLRKETSRAPFIETKTLKWKVSEGQLNYMEIDNEASSKLTSYYEKWVKDPNKKKAKYLTLANKNFIICLEKLQIAPYLINTEQLEKVHLEKEEHTHKWDFIQAFYPPQELSIENGKICKVIQIEEGGVEYEYVKNLFISTFQSGSDHNYMHLNIRVGPHNQRLGSPKVKRIEKIFNCVIYEKFMNELKRMLRKYPNMEIKNMAKHLFHGSKGSSPDLIYATEEGLDVRFSNSGVFGNGIYFADNSAYSHGYAWLSGQNEFQMFVCTVLVGDSVTLHGGQYRIPPNKPGSNIERYDSINNGAGGHYIIYDNVKCYPGYLVTYEFDSLNM